MKRKILLINIVSFFLLLLMLEGICQTLPVATLPTIQNINEQNYLRRLPSNILYTFSSERFDIVSYKRSNNLGFLSDVDYHKSSKPKFAIIGDSFVEAVQVSNSDSLQGLLQQKHPELMIYALATSGAQLPTYLSYARYAKEEFDAKHFCFVIIDNDFDESWGDNPSGFHYFENQNGQLSFKPGHYEDQKGIVKRALIKSDLFRYLYGNLKLHKKIQRFLADEAVKDFNVERDKVSIDLFFKELDQLLDPDDRVLFVFNGSPHRDVNSDIEQYFRQLTQYFRQKIEQRSYEGISMYDRFQIAENQGKTVIHPNDSHWNAYGHRLVAEQIETSKTFKNLTLPKPQ